MNTHSSTVEHYQRTLRSIASFVRINLVDSLYFIITLCHVLSTIIEVAHVATYSRQRHPSYPHKALHNLYLHFFIFVMSPAFLPCFYLFAFLLFWLFYIVFYIHSLYRTKIELTARGVVHCSTYKTPFLLSVHRHTAEWYPVFARTVWSD